jgi:tetratricopeptide (TPR) repeat protein
MGLRRALGLAAGMIVLGWLGYAIISNTAADTLAETEPEAALQWRPDSSVALVTLGENRLGATSPTDAELAEIAALGRRALAADPLAPRAIRLIGLTAYVKGDDAAADSIVRRAAARSYRDFGAWLWLFNQSMRRGDYREALTALDPLLRTHPELSDALFPSLVAIANDPLLQPSVVDLLANAPPWRAAFLRTLAQDPTGKPAANVLLTGLAATAHPPQSDELASYLDAVIADGDFRSAFLTWMKFLPPDQSRSVAFAYNGDFELPLTGLAFDWSLSPVRGAVSEVVDSGDAAAGKVLRVVFSDTRVAYRHTAKLMLLSPGNYELRGWIRTEELNTPRGMRWRVTCAVGKNQRLVESDPFKGTIAWREFTSNFSVPDKDCEAQWLRLELDIRVASDEQVVGTLWSDRISVRRMEGATAIN